jgi:hypothetical protein
VGGRTSVYRGVLDRASRLLFDNSVVRHKMQLQSPGDAARSYPRCCRSTGGVSGTLHNYFHNIERTIPYGASRRRNTGRRRRSKARRVERRAAGDRGGPIGVVKLLRARGGCLGVIRIRAWKAAKCPGKLPNERRSRNTRGTRGTETSQYPEERKSTEIP